MSRIEDVYIGAWGLGGFALYVGLSVGQFYSLYLIATIGGFVPFIIALVIIPCWFILAPVGLWSLLFGVPVWFVTLLS